MIFRIIFIGVRKTLDKARRFELRQQIQASEDQLEVSELEKILAHLAFLMNLYLEDTEIWPGLEQEFRERIGLSERASALPQEQSAWLRRKGEELHLGPWPFVTFYMWRAWILQAELDYASELRDDEEWGGLPQEFQDARRELNARLLECAQEIEDLLKRLPETTQEVAYMLRQVQGSPLAVLSAASSHLERAVGEIRVLEGKVRETYGFGGAHRPNRKFDLNAPRNLESLYLKYAVGSENERFIQPFREGPGSGNRSDKVALAEARKAAQRMLTNIGMYEQVLRRLEVTEDIPQNFFARRI